MKKIYKSLSLMAFVAVCSGAMAQAPTITSVAVPQIGYTYNMASDTLTADMPSYTVSPGSATAQSWDFSALFSNTYADPLSFVSKSNGTGNSTFTAANMASSVTSGTTTSWVYWIGNSSGLAIDGYYTTIQGSPTTIDFNPNPMQMAVPFTYGSSPVVNNYTATFTISVSGTTATVHHRAKRTITADAFGSLKTPAGTYANTLRVKTYETTSDSAYISGFFAQAKYDTTTNYAWLQNTQNANLMSININKSGHVTKAQYLQSFTNGVITINQPSTGFNLYPNPASDFTYFTYQNTSTGPVNIQILDITGKQVAVVVNEQQTIGQQNVAINLAGLHLPKGLYFVQLNSNNNLQTKKLIIQ